MVVRRVKIIKRRGLYKSFLTPRRSLSLDEVTPLATALPSDPASSRRIHPLPFGHPLLQGGTCLPIFSSGEVIHQHAPLSQKRGYLLAGIFYR